MTFTQTEINSGMTDLAFQQFQAGLITLSELRLVQEVYSPTRPNTSVSVATPTTPGMVEVAIEQYHAGQINKAELNLVQETYGPAK